MTPKKSTTKDTPSMKDYQALLKENERLKRERGVEKKSTRKHEHVPYRLVHCGTYTRLMFAETPPEKVKNTLLDNYFKLSRLFSDDGNTWYYGRRNCDTREAIADIVGYPSSNVRPEIMPFIYYRRPRGK